MRAGSLPARFGGALGKLEGLGLVCPDVLLGYTGAAKVKDGMVEPARALHQPSIFVPRSHPHRTKHHYLRNPIGLQHDL